MNSPFILSNEFRNTHIVSWPTFNDIRHVETKIKLLEVLFKHIKVNEAGLLLKYNQDELDIMWIPMSTYYQTPEIDSYMQDYYEIVGVCFNDKEPAELFKDYLDKKLVWKILND